MPIDALSVLCVTIAKFLLVSYLVTPKDIATKREKLRPDDRSTTKQTLTAISQTVEISVAGPSRKIQTNKQTNKQLQQYLTADQTNTGVAFDK